MIIFLFVLKGDFDRTKEKFSGGKNRFDFSSAKMLKEKHILKLLSFHAKLTIDYWVILLKLFSD